MKNKKKLNLKKMNITQLGSIGGGNATYPTRTADVLPTEQVVGGGGVCYSNARTSCLYCV